jgi:hypothetical protein
MVARANTAAYMRHDSASSYASLSEGGGGAKKEQ